MKRSGLHTLAALFVVLASISFFHPYPYDNVVTRWALARRLVDDASINIDPYARHTNDKAFRDGHYYCDKAVLLSLAAAAPYGLTRVISGVTGRSVPDPVARYLAERLLETGSLLLLLLFLHRNLSEKKLPTAIPVTALGTGSILLPYSTLLYGHVPAAMLLFLCYHFQERKRYLLSDISGALAVAVEFPVFVPFAVILAYRGRKYWTPARLFRATATLAATLLPQFLYNARAFGSPSAMGYSMEAEDAFGGMKSGFFGFTLPSPRSLYLLTLSPERGLFFYMPWTLPGLAGFFAGGKPREVLRRNPLPAAVILYVLLFSAYYMPDGGWAYGPRHLIPVIPFLAVGLGGFVAGDGKRTFIAAAAMFPAMLLALLGAAGEIHQPVFPPDGPLPLPQVKIGLEMMMRGHHSLWLPGTAGVLLLLLALPVMLFRVARNSKFSWAGILLLSAWAAVGWLSMKRDMGGIVDYYRGILAQHREEWNLAEDYYERALEDPNAPPVVRERLRFCRGMSDGMGEGP